MRQSRYIIHVVCLSATLLFMIPAVTHAGPKIVIIGDSTVQTYAADRDVRGWGQYFGDCFTDDVTIVNHAISGRSTKTFIEEERWDRAVAENADYVLIQFGHNDSHAKDKPESTDSATDYRDYLRRYVDESRASGAIPVLITPMHRRRFIDGVPTQELKPYADAMKIVALEKNAVLIDLHTLSGEVLARRGDDGSADLYVNAEDRTHFSEKGARLLGRLVAHAIGETGLDLAHHVTAGLLRHVVLFGFREDAPADVVEKVEAAFRELPSKIGVIHGFEWGTNVSPENIARGYTHCFFLTFLTEEDRDAYLPHPAHKAFGKILAPVRDKVLVLDYWTR